MRFPRFAYLATSALFLVFLIYSAPHQVHHFFDQHKASQHGLTVDQYPQGEHHQSNSQDTSCVFQTVAKSCHANLTSPIHAFSVPLFTKKLSSPFKARISSPFLPGAFQIRAPPKA